MCMLLYVHFMWCACASIYLHATACHASCVYVLACVCGVRVVCVCVCVYMCQCVKACLCVLCEFYVVSVCLYHIFMLFLLHIERLQQENAYLQKEATRNAVLQAESEGLSQMKQLAGMLQESHHSLLATNTQLLREVEEAKERHARELEQMHTNYEHLRKTVDIIHST